MVVKKRKIIFVSILVALLAAVYLFGFSQQQASAPYAENDSTFNNSGVSTDSALTAPDNAKLSPTPVKEIVTPAEPSVAALIAALSNTFKDTLSSRFPVKGALRIQHILLVGSLYAYVDYSDANKPRRLLLKITGTNPFSFKALGYFTPGQSGWVLQKGQDKLLKDQPWVLYEFDAATGNWVKKN